MTELEQQLTNALKGSAHIRVEIQHKDPFLSGPARPRTYWP